MPRVATSGVHLQYELHGADADPLFVLIRGLGTQLIHWPSSLIETLVRRGFRVLTFDNRDVGLSDKCASPPPAIDAVIAALRRGESPPVPYTLRDMADDVIGLLDAVSVPRAHVVGMSMGGRIAQCVARRAPARTATLCSIMASTGNPNVKRPSPDVIEAALGNPLSSSRDDVVEHTVATEAMWAGTRYFYERDELTTLAKCAYDRCFCPEGVARQVTAMIAMGDQSKEASQIRVPTLIIHGADDTLVPPDSGEDAARTIPNARLVMVEGMGHAIPASLGATIGELLADHARRFEQP